MGTVAALFFIYKQVQHARNVAAYEFLRREDDRFRSDEMRKHRSQIARVLLSQPDNFDELDAVADFLLDYFEDLGVITRQGLAPMYFVWSMNCYYALRYWHALSRYINWSRAQSNDATYYADFEYLYRQVSKLERQQTGRKVIPFSDADLRDFLREELDVTIRHFRPSDLRAVMRIEKAAFAIDHYPESQFKELQKEHPDDFFVAEFANEVVGYAIGYVTDGKAELDSVAVDPKYWNLGIGTALTKHRIERFKSRGIVKCTLEVRVSNVRAVSFYEHFGFRIIDTAKDYYADKGDAYAMEMSVPTGKQLEENGVRGTVKN